MNDNIETAVQEAPKHPEFTPEQILHRRISKMPNRQLSNRLHRLHAKNNKMSNIDAAWTIILMTVFDNTRSSGMGGKLSPFLR